MKEADWHIHILIARGNPDQDRVIAVRLKPQGTLEIAAPGLQALPAGDQMPKAYELVREALAGIQAELDR